MAEDFKSKLESKEVMRSVEYAAAYGVKNFACIPEVLIQPRYDLIYQEVTLFIEGVQVPFDFFSVSSAYGATPEATIAVPYFPGILEICKGYFPKVHIFFKDLTFEKFLNINGIDYEEKDLRRLLFQGVIVGSSYSKSKSTDMDAVQVSFRCVHKYYAMQEIILKMIGGGTEQLSDQTRGQEIATGHMFNSMAYTTLAMAGVKTPAESSDRPVYRPDDSNKVDLNKVNNSHLQEDLIPYQDRLTGMTGILVNVWNSLKTDSYRRMDVSKMMTDLYIPLVDGGLKFFKRLSGHPVIEGAVTRDKTQIPKNIKERLAGTKNVDETITIIAPPTYANFLQKAATIESGVVAMVNFFSQQTEASDYIGLVAGVLKYLKYDLEVLTSPVQVLDSSMESIDVIVKPTLPQYYSPTCNVLLPHMHSSVRYDDFTYAVPTRMFASMQPYPGINPEQQKKSYLTPEEARIATCAGVKSDKFNLNSSTVYIGGYPTPTEYGRGVKVRVTNLDPWIQHINLSDLSQEKGQTTYASGNSSYQAPTQKLIAAGRALINTGVSELEDLSNENRVWKYWDKAVPIPKYIASVDVPGWNMQWGVEGELSPQDINVVSKITPFRSSTKVPKYWNVLYFPDKDAFLAFPPHYDYMRNEFYQTAELEAAKASYGYDPYVPRGTSSTVDISSSNQSDASDLFTQSVVGGTPVLDILLAEPGENEDFSIVPEFNIEKISQAFSTYAGYKTYDEIREILKNEWNVQHPGMPSLNPYESTSVNGIQPFESTIYNYMDYEHALAMTDSRTGGCECPFNPFIIPGYPMDIVEASPEKPSVHAFCTSVTHSGTGASLSTNVTFIGAVTYDELRAYSAFPVPPWFAYHLGLTQTNSIMNQSDSALEIASQFYMDTLGVGVADPSKLEDYVSGGASTVMISEGNMVKEGRNLFDRDSFGDVGTPFTGASFKEAMNPNASYSGNMALVRREIESQVDVEKSMGVAFIEIQSRRNFPSSMDSIKVSPLYREVAVRPGRSVFLDYSLEDKLLSDSITAKTGTVDKAGTAATTAGSTTSVTAEGTTTNTTPKKILDVGYWSGR